MSVNGLGANASYTGQLAPATRDGGKADAKAEKSVPEKSTEASSAPAADKADRGAAISVEARIGALDAAVQTVREQLLSGADTSDDVTPDDALALAGDISAKLSGMTVGIANANPDALSSLQS